MSRRPQTAHRDCGVYWVSGEVGQGKTTLLRDLSKRLRQEGFSCALVPVANLDAESLIIWCLHQLSLPRDGGIDALTRVAELGLFVLVDDAEHLPIDSSMLLTELASQQCTRVLCTGTGAMPTRLAPAEQLFLGGDRSENLERTYSILQPQASLPPAPAVEIIPSTEPAGSSESEASRVATEGSTDEAPAPAEDLVSVPIGTANSPQSPSESMPTRTLAHRTGRGRVNRSWVFLGAAAAAGLFLVVSLLNRTEPSVPDENLKTQVSMQAEESATPQISMAAVKDPAENSGSTDLSVDDESTRSSAAQSTGQSVALRMEPAPPPPTDSGKLLDDTRPPSRRPDEEEPVARALPISPVSPSQTRSPVPPVEYTRVVVNAVPSAHVWIDGEAVGGTPIAELKVSPGMHHFRADFPDGSGVARDVEITGEFVLLVFP